MIEIYGGLILPPGRPTHHKNSSNFYGGLVLENYIVKLV